ncbi:MAG TPA: methyl-accepting chemotaxis protein [Methanosarcina sp.]|nr:methyl-accepting chemotaxis protein [Methanosarcina sp.]
MERSFKANENENSSQKYITDAERKQLLSALHCRLFWVGQHIPDYVEFEGKRYPLHNYVWEMIQKENLTSGEKSRIDKCIDIISAKEKEDEKYLEEKPLTEDEAKSLYHETAGLLRAIMDLKEIESGALKESTKRFQEQFISQRVRDAKLWLEFIKNVSK